MMKKALFIFLLLSTAIGHASETNHSNRIHLSADASMQVANDTLVAVLYSQQEGLDTTDLADKVNRQISVAIQIAEKMENIDVKTLSYNTSPVYKKSQVSGWRVKQSIQLKSRDSQALSKLIGRLQSTLAVQSINYMVSDQARKTAQDELIVKALTNFETRAELISKTMHSDKYKLIEMSVNTGYSGQPQQPVMRSMAAEAYVASPTLQPGKQQLTVSVSGSIELLL